MSPRRQQL